MLSKIIKHPAYLKLPCWRAAKASPIGIFKFKNWNDWEPQNPDHAFTRKYIIDLKRVELINQRVHELETQWAVPNAFHAAVGKELAHARRLRDFLHFSLLISKVENGLTLIFTALRDIPPHIYAALKSRNCHGQALFLMQEESKGLVVNLVRLSRALMVYRPVPLAWDHTCAQLKAYSLFHRTLELSQCINKLVDIGIDLGEPHHQGLDCTSAFRSLLSNGTVTRLHIVYHELLNGRDLVEAILINRERLANPRVWIMDSILIPIWQVGYGLHRLSKRVQTIMTHYEGRARRESVDPWDLCPVYSELGRIFIVISNGSEWILSDMVDLTITTAERVSRIEPGQELNRQVHQAMILVTEYERRRAEVVRHRGVFTSGLRPWKKSKQNYIPLPIFEPRSLSQHSQMLKITHHMVEKVGWSPPDKQVRWKRCTIHDYSPPVASCRT